MYSDSGKVFAGFSWHSIHPGVVREARRELSGAKIARQTLCATEGWQTLADGVYGPFKTSAPFPYAYNWVLRKIGLLKGPDGQVLPRGNTPEWRVVGHERAYVGEVVAPPTREGEGNRRYGRIHTPLKLMLWLYNPSNFNLVF